jgi:hypothetical protein
VHAAEHEARRTVSRYSIRQVEGNPTNLEQGWEAEAREQGDHLNVRVVAR